MKIYPKQFLRKLKKVFASGKFKIGLALGGGGARGLCHIGFLKVFDELEVKPSVISGTSIGALIGGLYCSGLTAGEIEQAFSDLNFFKWSSLIDFSWTSNKSFIKGQKILDVFKQHVKEDKFEDLKIPLKVVATDFWDRKPMVFTSGDLLQAVRASISIPGIFEPVIVENKVLTDGGAVNPVPYDVIADDCDYIIAIDVTGENSRENKEEKPGFIEVILNSFAIMETTIVNNKIKLIQPDLYLKPKLSRIEILDFHKINEIISDSKQDCQLLKKCLVKYFHLKPKIANKSKNKMLGDSS